MKNTMEKKWHLCIKQRNRRASKKGRCHISKNKEDLVGAWCKVYRKDWKYPIVKEVNFDEYVQKKSDGTPNTNWANRPVTMLTKVASVQALRKAFIEELSGMYEAKEMGIDGKELDEAPIEQPKDIEIQEVETIDENDNDLENELSWHKKILLNKKRGGKLKNGRNKWEKLNSEFGIKLIFIS